MSMGKKTVLEVVNITLGRLRMPLLTTTTGSMIGNLLVGLLQEVLDEMEQAWIWTDLMDTITIEGNEIDGSFYLPETSESTHIERVWNDTQSYELRQTSQGQMNIMRRTTGSEGQTGAPEVWTTNGHDPVTGELNIDFWRIPALGQTLLVDVRSPHEDVIGKDNVKVRLPNRPVVLGLLWKYKADSKGADHPDALSAQRVYEAALRDAIALDNGQQPGRTDWVPV